jgi:TetR/AcrR family transcriptional repressor of nem operon
VSAPNAREKLSASAAVLFRRFGYARVSIRDITSSVGIPKGTFYNHFKSKEALASAILSQHFNALLEALAQGGSETAGARLRRHFESIAPSAHGLIEFLLAAARDEDICPLVDEELRCS